MRVLVLESEPGIADDVVAEFTASGHSVARCHDEDRPPFPCHGMDDGGQCPLDDSSVQVAVAIDGHEGSPDSLPAGHDGARCALRRAVPLVVAGPSGSPLAPWATTAVTTFDPGTVVTAAEDAAAAPLERHSEAALAAMRSVLEIHDNDTAQATANVIRRGDELTVVLNAGVGDLVPRVREVISIRALAAVRVVDPFTPRISVTVDDKVVSGT